ncbi:MAG: 5-oxoprolinase subunit PxpB [Allomuricauda sp.]|nr:MAG: 5-oxoprolinase subunit PxpB [Allomuricauda sp.]
MKSYPITIRPFGENAILIEWPNEVSEAILNDILRFETFLKEKQLENFEYVPAYNSLTLVNFFGITESQNLQNKLKHWYKELPPFVEAERFLYELPVCYDTEFGIDLQETAKILDFSIDELIAAHSTHEYTVFGIGFLPGFMYLGGLPSSLETSRRKEPRLKVKKGSVGLAGKQTGIYPQESPGGWNIIGNCPIPIFNQNSETPCFIKVGDKVRFVPITRAEYDLLKIEGEVGIFNPKKIELSV